MVYSRIAAYLPTRVAHWAALGIFVVLSLVFYAPFLRYMPEGLHAWAQADRLALAINFYDFGFDFWHPRTSSLTSIGGVTGVELPLPAYLAALGGVVFGRGAITVLFRLLDVGVAVLGFWYLFRIVFERTHSFVAGLVPAAFLLCSPTYAFYASTYLPDPVSLSLSFVGYYYWLRFFSTGVFRNLVVAIMVLALASLLKTTTAMYLAVVLGITILWAMLQPELLSLRQRQWLLALAVAAFGIQVLFMRHNQTLNTTYASIQFLAEVRPITDAETSHRVWTNLRSQWFAEFATRTMYRVLAGCALLLLVFGRTNLRRANLPLTLLVLGGVGMACVFFQLMGAQFDVHDYYMICSFAPPAVLLLVLSLLSVGRYTGRVRIVFNLGLAVLVVLLLTSGYKRLQRRYSDDYPPFSLSYGHHWMRGGADLLRQLAVPATARVLVLDEVAPNLGLVYFDRRGLTWKPELAGLRSATLLNKMAGDSLNYLIMPPAAYAKLAPEHQALNNDFVLLAQRPVVVLRRRDIARPW
jgi:hypothetical protein